VEEPTSSDGVDHVPQRGIRIRDGYEDAGDQQGVNHEFSAT
jgi:hypothetical protein